MSFYRGPVTHPVHQVIRLSYWPGSSVSQQMLLCNYCQSHCHQPGERLGAGLSQNPGSEFPCTSPATRSHPFLYEDLGQSSRLAMVVWDKPIHQQGQPGECRAAAVGLLDQLGAVQVLPWVSSQDPHVGANPCTLRLVTAPQPFRKCQPMTNFRVEKYNGSVISPHKRQITLEKEAGNTSRAGI